MYRLLSYLRFILTATNQHGVHSPFIYNFITKGIYRKGNPQFTITQNLLAQSIFYFNFKKIGLVSEDNSLKIKLNSVFEGLDYNALPIDIVYADDKSEPFKTISRKYLHNDSLLLIEGIHNSKKKYQNWEQLKKLPEVSVSIDLFHCGILFFRREQVKEHFKIRRKPLFL
ncbi:hypothetical protein ACOCEA_15560 [Maribacter sp. CXY002]|uniref:hypothetical protein n=1 Tax=Maribacter luteocoastalis TaxID=3407671 RepID=UPI003B6764E4